MDPNCRGATEGTLKIFELFSVSQITLTLVLKCDAHRNGPQLGPPISANLRMRIDDQSNSPEIDPTEWLDCRLTSCHVPNKLGLRLVGAAEGLIVEYFKACPTRTRVSHANCRTRAMAERVKLEWPATWSDELGEQVHTLIHAVSDLGGAIGWMSPPPRAETDRAGCTIRSTPERQVTPLCASSRLTNRS
jgi:hypothetical protein